jgi:hypothetical protein
MRRGDRQRAIAHLVARGAKHLEAVAGIAGDAAVVLLVLCVSEQDGADDLVAHGGA